MCSALQAIARLQYSSARVLQRFRKGSGCEPIKLGRPVVTMFPRKQACSDACLVTALS